MLPRLLLPTLLLVAPAAAAAQSPKVPVDLLGDPLPHGAIARFGTLRLSHPGVGSLTFSPDGKTLVSGGINGNHARLWDAATGKLLHEIPVREGVVPKYDVPTPPVPPSPIVLQFSRFMTHGFGISPRYTPVAFAPNGLAVLASSAPCCRWWDPATGKTRPLWDSKDKTAISAAFAPDGKTLALALIGGEVVILDVASGKERGRLATPWEDVPADVLAFAPDNRTLAVGFGLGNVWLWDCVQGKRLRWYLIGRNLSIYDRVTAVSFPGDGKSVAVAAGTRVKRFETATDAEVAGFTPVELEESLRQLRYATDGKTLIGVTECARVLVWDGTTGKQLQQMRHAPKMSGLAVLGPMGQTLAYSEGSSLFLVDAKTGKHRVSVRSNPALLSTAFADRLGQTAVSADWQGNLHFWDVATGKEKRQLAFPQLEGTQRAPLLSPDGKRVATWTKGLKSFQIVDAQTGKELWTAEPKGDSAERLAFAPDGRTLAAVTAQSQSLDVWDVATGKRLYALPLPGNPGNLQPVFAPDGRSLAAVGLNHQGAFVWELASRTLRQEIEVNVPLAVAFSRDGKQLAVVAQWDCPLLFQLGTKKPPLRLAPRGDLHRVALLPDGRWLAAGDSTGGIHVWEVKGSRHYSWPAHEGGVTALAFSPDGTRLLSAGMDGIALVWKVNAFPRSSVAKEQGPSFEQCWQALAGGDSVAALRAMAALTGRPEEAVVFLKARLTPIEPADAKQLAQWLKDLDSAQFGARERATRGLQNLGDRAERALRTALTKPLSAEGRKRAQELLDRLEGALTQPERLRAVRGVEVLERIGSAEAVALLEALTQGAPGALLTREAQASLDRLRWQ